MATKTLRVATYTTFQNTRLGLSLFVASLALYITIIWFIQATFQAIDRSEMDQPLNRWQKVNDSTTIAVLQILQGVLGLAISAALRESFELLQWYLTARSCGLSYAAFLSLSPSTSFVGTSRIIFSYDVTSLERLLAVFKVVLQLLAWLAGLLLFGKL